MMSNRSIPVPDMLTEFYWSGTKEGKLLIQRCEDCRHWNHPPKPRCAKCSSHQLKPESAPLKGEVYTFSITMQSRIQGFEESVPYAVVTVKLEGTPIKIITNMLECGPQDIYIGMPVNIVFEERDGFSFPQSVPAN